VAVADVIIRDVVLPLRRHRLERPIATESDVEPLDEQPPAAESVSMEEGE
jgi:hypothetical protein